MERLPDDLALRLETVRARIRAACERGGRTPEEVGLVAVTKGVEGSRIREARALGLTDFGESRVQEALPKIAALDPAIRWHLVGHLQRNKTGRAADTFALIHSLDSVALGEELARRGEAMGRPVAVLLQVNVAAEASKRGMRPGEVAEAARRLGALAGLRLEGLMTIAPLVHDPEEVRPVFRELRRLGQVLAAERAEARHLSPGVSGHLSMGMSDDFEVAIEEGATVIRVGRALFGERAPR